MQQVCELCLRVRNVLAPASLPLAAGASADPRARCCWVDCCPPDLSGARLRPVQLTDTRRVGIRKADAPAAAHARERTRPFGVEQLCMRARARAAALAHKLKSRARVRRERAGRAGRAPALVATVA